MVRKIGRRYSEPSVQGGQLITAKELEQIFIEELEKSGGTDKKSLLDLARLYSMEHRPNDACTYLKRLLALASEPEERAHCFHFLGEMTEKLGDYSLAAEYYKSAYALDASDADASYWIRNNLGYSLNQLGQYAEAEPYLRQAIQIFSDRANAYKNLGLCLEGMGNLRDAARSYVAATQVCPDDSRAVEHMEKMLENHPELLQEYPELSDQLRECKEAVRASQSENN